MKNQYSIFQYTKQQELYPISLLLVLFLLGIAFLFIQPHLFEDSWGKWIEFYLSFATLIFSGLIWWRQLKNAHRDNLPKKLNITYQYKTQVWKIKNAPLVEEGDIRAWGQSLGNATFNKVKFFKIKNFSIDPPIHLKNQTLFELTIFLDEALESDPLHCVAYNDDGTISQELNSQ